MDQQNQRELADLIRSPSLIVLVLSTILASALLSCSRTGEPPTPKPQIVESGREAGFDWDLGWYRDPDDADIPCVAVVARSDNMTARTASCPPEPTTGIFASWATNGVTGQAVIGFLPAGFNEVTSTQPAALHLSEPVDTLAGGRVFVQFAAEDDTERIVVSSGEAHLALKLDE